jgi:hypothetical protein
VFLKGQRLKEVATEGLFDESETTEVEFGDTDGIGEARALRIEIPAGQRMSLRRGDDKQRASNQAEGKSGHLGHGITPAEGEMTSYI